MTKKKKVEEVKKPWWWPTEANDEWRAQLRKDYPETAKDMSDDDLDAEYNEEGYKYVTTWDHLGDAREDHEQLADAFLKLCAETGKKPSDFMD